MKNRWKKQKNKVHTSDYKVAVSISNMNSYLSKADNNSEIIRIAFKFK